MLVQDPVLQPYDAVIDRLLLPNQCIIWLCNLYFVQRQRARSVCLFLLLWSVAELDPFHARIIPISRLGWTRSPPIETVEKSERETRKQWPNSSSKIRLGRFLKFRNCEYRLNALSPYLRPSKDRNWNSLQSGIDPPLVWKRIERVLIGESFVLSKERGRKLISFPPSPSARDKQGDCFLW